MKSDNFQIEMIYKNIAMWSYYTLTLCPLIFHHKKAYFLGYPKDHQYRDEQEHLWLASSFSLRFWYHISAAKKENEENTKRENKMNCQIAASLETLSNKIIIVSNYRLQTLSKVCKIRIDYLPTHLQHTNITFIIPRCSCVIIFLKP
jgi:hypothetical protein